MLTIETKEDSHEKLASVNGKPTHFYLFAQEFNAIVQKINEVYLGLNPNRITGLGTEIVEGNQHTYQGYSWVINGAELDNIDNASVVLIPAASEGFRRKDISVFNEAGNIVRVPGTETDGDIATTPDVPENTIYFRTYDVVGEIVTSDTTPPFVGIEYKTKRESDSYVYTNQGENVILPLPAEGQSHLIIENDDLISIDGFDKSLLMLVRNSEYPYEGKDFLFENKSPNPVQLNNLTSAVIPIELGADLTVPSGGKIWFKYKSDVLFFVMKSWNDPIDLSTKADLVGGKVPLTQLPEIIDELYRSWFSYTPNNAGSWLVVNTGNPLTISGTSAVVPRSGTTIYGSIIMNNCISATPNGSNAGIKNNNASDGTYREGVDAYFIWANNDVNNQCCASVGLYSLLSTPPNLNPSNFTASTMICANDQGESNLSFMVNRTAILSNFIKIDCGSDFPAHSNNDAYLLRIQINKTENQNERIGKMTIYNIVTGKTFSHTFTGLQMPDSNSNFSVMINRGNRNTGVATNIRPAKIYCNRKLY